MPVSATAGALLCLDWDLDGDADCVRMEDSSLGTGTLWVRQTDGSNPLQPFANLFGADPVLGSVINFVYDQSFYACYELTGPITSSCVGDFDDDGDVDFAMMAPNPGQIAIKLGINEEICDFWSRLDYQPEASLTISGGKEHVTVTFHPAWDMSALNAETKLRAELWVEQGLYGAMEEVVDAFEAPINIPLTLPMAVTFSCPLSLLQSNTIRHFVLTPFTDVGGVEVSRAPSAVILYTRDPDTQNTIEESFPGICTGGGSGSSCGTMTSGGRGSCGTGGSGTGGGGGG